MNDDDNLQELFDKVFSINLELAQEYSIEMLAGVLMSQAIRFYKTILNDEDYNSLVAELFKSFKTIKPYTEENFTDKKSTLH